MRASLRIMIAAALISAGASSGCTADPDPAAGVWKRRCAACHGSDGAGRTRFAEGRPYADLTDGKWKHGPDREALRRLVAEGDPTSTMPPFAGTLSPEEIDAVVGWALALSARPEGGSAR
ncbi:MAG TPA: cytochrome c [Thermoanaerobaculia bacterium]|nr:cytochrome c [Thermoanaerobaculia bacterium]